MSETATLFFQDYLKNRTVEDGRDDVIEAMSHAFHAGFAIATELCRKPVTDALKANLSFINETNSDLIMVIGTDSQIIIRRAK